MDLGWQPNAGIASNSFFNEIKRSSMMDSLFLEKVNRRTMAHEAQGVREVSDTGLNTGTNKLNGAF